MARSRKKATSLLKTIEGLLREAFPPPDVISLRDEDGIIGVITSSRFSAKDSIDRQSMIWDVLDRHMAPEQRRQIVIIVAVTPEEEIAYTA